MIFFFFFFKLLVELSCFGNFVDVWTETHVRSFSVLVEIPKVPRNVKDFLALFFYLKNEDIYENKKHL